MAHRASARKLMHDPDSAEGLMAVLSHPDSSEARPATAIIVGQFRAAGKGWASVDVAIAERRVRPKGVNRAGI